MCYRFRLVGESITYFEWREKGVSTITSTSHTAAGAAWRVRALAVVGAAAAALVVWAVAKALGGDLHQPTLGNGAPQQLSAGTVIAAALIGGPLGWAAISQLERWAAHPRRIRGSRRSARAARLGRPRPVHGISAANRLSLVLMRVVAMAGVFIPRCQRTAVERAVSRRVG
jgi:hypothetical protein